MPDSKNLAEQVILGIDPGTNVMGYGVIAIRNKKIELLCMGSIHLNRMENHQLKLGHIFERVSYLVEEYGPDFMAIEAPFFGKNVQSMLKLGRAQGVCMAAALVKQVPVVEYSPKKIKLAITGNGNASKEQVAAMLKSICKFEESPKYLDATDALAASVCHYFQNKNPIKRSSYSSWEDFAKKNEKRVK